MKFAAKAAEAEKIEFDMTPMIDVCFQLIIFFMLCLKLFAPEGDFGIKMPLTAPSAALPNLDQLPPIKVRLIAGPNGKLAGIQMGQRSLDSLKELHAQIRQTVGSQPASGGGGEVEFDCDYGLRYEYLIQAVSAVSGYRDGDRVIKLIEKIRFSGIRKP